MIRTRCPNCGAKYTAPGELPERLKCDHCKVTFFPQPVDEVPEPPEEAALPSLPLPAQATSSVSSSPTAASLASQLSAPATAEAAAPVHSIASHTPPEALTVPEPPPGDSAAEETAETHHEAGEDQLDEADRHDDESDRRQASDDDHSASVAPDEAAPAEAPARGGKKAGRAFKPRPKWLSAQPKRKSVPVWLQNFLQSRSKSSPRRGAAPPKLTISTTVPPPGDDVGRHVEETDTPLKSLASLIVEGDGAKPSPPASDSPEPTETYGLASSAEALKVTPSAEDDETQELAVPPASAATSAAPSDAETPSHAAATARAKRPRGKGRSPARANEPATSPRRKPTTAFLMACGYVAGVATSLAAVLLFRLSFVPPAGPPATPAPVAPVIAPSNPTSAPESQSSRVRPTPRTAGAALRAVN